MLSKNGWLLGLLFVLIIIFIAACQSDKSTGNGTTNDHSNSSEANKNDQNNDSPKYGGHIKLYSYADPDTLDPHKTSAVATNDRIGLVYNKLITFETGPGHYSTSNIVPDLAKDWEISDDGLTYTFYLRDDVKWHNVEPVNGRSFTSDDVLATIERIRTLPGHQTSLLEKVESVEAPDDYTVVFKLSEPYSPFLNHMASYYMWILPREALEGKIDLDNTAVGTGPFILKEWKRNVEATYVKNPDYFEEGKPYLEKVTIFPHSDPTQEINAFRTGQVDVIQTSVPTDYETLKQAVPDAQIQTEIISATRLFINQTREPLNNLLVRKAMSKAIDRESAWQAIYGTGEYSSYILPTLEEWVLSKEERKSYQDYDPEGAKQLLTEAGYPDGFEVSMIVTDGYGPLPVTTAEWVAEDLKNIGIDVNIEVLEYATFFSNRWPNLEYDIGIGLVTPVTDPSETLIPYFKSDGFRNWQGVNDPKLDEMLEEQNIILDKNERINKINEIERYLYEEVSNHVNIFAFHVHYFKQPYVRGYDVHSNYGLIFMKDVWLDKEE